MGLGAGGGGHLVNMCVNGRSEMTVSDQQRGKVRQRRRKDTRWKQRKDRKSGQKDRNTHTHTQSK